MALLLNNSFIDTLLWDSLFLPGLQRGVEILSIPNFWSYCENSDEMQHNTRVRGYYYGFWRSLCLQVGSIAINTVGCWKHTLFELNIFCNWASPFVSQAAAKTDCL